MFCRNCGKELDKDVIFCPECGKKQIENSNENITQSSVANQSINTMSIIGLVVSGISIFLNFWGLIGIAGTILSVIGFIGCQKKNEKGKVLAIIGIIIGCISILYGFVVVLSFM